MPDIHIRRKHQLGLPEARKIAAQWCGEVKTKFDMDCSTVKGETSDTVSFKRVGASGTLLVAADHFELNAQLGFLLGAFSTTIESEIERNLDDLLAEHKASTRKAAAKKPAAKSLKS